MTTLNTREHQPAEACDEVHCYACGVDEDHAACYLRCFECGHVYATAGALRSTYRRRVWLSMWRWARPPWWAVGTWARIVWDVATVRARTVFFCQHCLHDFAWHPAWPP